MKVSHEQSLLSKQNIWKLGLSMISVRHQSQSETIIIKQNQ